MDNIKKISLPNRIILLLTLIHWGITFYTDRFVFTVSPADELFNYSICKALLFILLFFLYRTIYRTCFMAKRKETVEYNTIHYALIYCIPIIAVLAFKLPQGFLSNDETLIFKEAAALASYTWFYYLTTYYYIVTMMLIPCWLGPVLIKVLLQILVCGYCTWRLSRYMKDRCSYLLYLAFLLPPVLAYTTSAHRIPIYYLLYLFLIFLLLMDKLEKVTPSAMKVISLLILGALLTQWRTEGIYMLALVPILLFIAYPSLRHKKKLLPLLLCSLMLQYIVTIPQNGGLFPDRLNDQAANRMGPFYAYTITNMYRNGLDLTKNKEDLEQIDRYLNLDTIAAINRDLGDINYEDVLILYYEGYTGTRPEADSNDYMAYVNACRNIFIHNPLVLLKTRIGAFGYAAMPYHIAWTSGGLRGFAGFIISIIKTCAYNLYLPHMLLLILWIYSILRLKPFTFFMTSGLLCHWFIVFVLAPASYFKYYFPVYMCMYFYLILLAAVGLYNRKHLTQKISVLV